MIGISSAGLFGRPAGGGGGGAPTASSYIVIGADGTLTNERVLVGTAAQVILTDGGAGGNITLSLPQDIDLTSSPTFAQLTLEDGVLQSNLDFNLFGVDSASMFNFQPDPASSGPIAQIAASRVIIGDDNTLGVNARFHIGQTFTLPTGVHPPTPTENVQRIYFDTYQAGAVGQGRVGLSVAAYDAAAAVNKTITGAANNGSGLIRITATSHGFTSNDRINIYDVTGTTEANGVWDITVITANTFDLQGSTFSNAYVSGGTATNRSAMYGMSVTLKPMLNRIGTTGTGANGDDVNGFTIHNIGTGKATEAIYVANSGSVTGPGWYGVFSSPANADYGLLLTGEYAATSSNTGLPGACAWLRSNHTSDTTTTETQRNLYVKPVFNFGTVTPNANKTVNVVDIDTENVSVTGAMVNLLKASYGGTQRLNLASSGNTRITASDAASTFTDNAGTSRSAGFSVDQLVTTLSATYQANAFLTHVDWASDPGSRVTNGVLSHVTTASDSIAQASATYRAFNGLVTHNGTNTVANMTGQSGTVNNATTGTVTQMSGFVSTIQNSSTGTIGTAYGLLVNLSNTSGTVTETYGVYIGDITAGTQTSAPYAFYNADTQNSRNYFGSAAFNGFGTATPLSKLHIEGSNGWIIQDEQDTNPTTTELDADDSVAIYNKADKFVIAYNNGGTMTYISIPLDGSTTTWTHSTSAP